MIANVRRKGVRRVTGKVVINKTRLGKIRAGLDARQLAWSYSAPVSAVVINENAMPITLRASDTIGKQKVQMNRYQNNTSTVPVSKRSLLMMR